MTMPPPSPMTKPSRVESNGREAVSGESLRSERAFMFAKPPIAIGVTVISEPPVIMMSASPYWIVRKASPIAWALVAQAEIDYINAHGTSTPANDLNETKAIKAVFGEHAGKVNVSSTKSMTGHMLGAAGAVEFIIGALAVRDCVIPPTINYKNPDPDLDLNYTPNTAVNRPVRTVLSNSFGFGGHNVTLAIKRFEG